MDSKEKGNPNHQNQGTVTELLDQVKIQSHVLVEHATIIYTRSEMALEEVVEPNHRLRSHLTAIHESAGTVSESSKKLRRLVSE